MKAKDKGFLIIYSGPSGVGKGTVRKHLFDNYGKKLFYSISMTTRAPREGEVDGVDYYFVTREEFERQIKNNNFLEYAEFVGNYYGTPKDKVEEKLNAGWDVMLEIEVQGAEQVMAKVPDAVSIFLVPPDLKTLEKRLRDRGTDSDEVIAKRLAKASGEINLAKNYDYIVVNDTVESASEKIMEILSAEHTKF